MMKADISWVKKVEGDFAFSDPWARFTEIAGLVIESVHVDTDGATINFADRQGYLLIQDGGQSCCETRYVTCDDDLSGHAGGSLLAIDTDAAGSQPEPEKDDDGYDYGNCHEVQFVKVQTTKGSFTLCTHNEHNGYYGGFSIDLKLVR